MSRKALLPFLIITFFGVFIWSGIRPHDYFTWALEVFPAILGFVILASTFKKFRMSELAYLLIWMHAIVLVVGGHYTYAEVPLFNWIRDTFDLSRNYYDRVGHFMQGFVPAIISREILIRMSPVKKGGWLYFIVVSICLSISALYELFEWGVAIATGTAAEDFLGTQGDIWDTQWDMFLALCGANLALILLGRIHDNKLKKFSS